MRGNISLNQGAFAVHLSFLSFHLFLHIRRLKIRQLYGKKIHFSTILLTLLVFLCECIERKYTLQCTINEPMLPKCLSSTVD